ncbi:MAG: xylulokinase [Verrucomicrobiota bacterium]|nr:xylulokinase [Verrucomicrobiota bacterium]
MNTIGLDIGTSSVKALLVSASGEVLKVSAPEYPFQTPKPLWAETDPTVWWNATQEAIRQLLEGQEAKNVGGIGLTGQMHGMVALDASGEVLRPCIMWNDQRSFAECEEMTSLIGKEQVLKITGNPILAGFTAPKILWVQKNEPDVFSSIDKILLPKDFIRYKLSGEFFSDVSDASGMSLLNVGNREWSSDILDVLGWKREWLPEVTESTEVSAKLSSTASDLTGLPAGIPIVSGGGDCAAQAVGSSIVEEGKVSVTLGTSGVVFAQSDEYRVETQGKLHSFCHAVPGKWHMMGVMLSAAGSFQWFKNKFGAEESRIEEAGGLNAYENLTNQAALTEPGSEGCVFLPYLSGERTPHPDPHARGAFIGLSLRHGMGHMARAVLEGVSFGLNDSLSLMRNLGINPTNVILSGGGTRSPLWKQMLADVFHSNCSLVNAKEGAAYGAALLASVGIGCHDSVENASRNWIQETENIQIGEEAKIYQKLYPFYQNLYPVLKNHFQSMAEVLGEDSKS